MHEAERLFGALFRGIREGELIELRAFKQGPERDQTQVTWLRQPSDIIDHIMPEMFDVYFGVNPRRGRVGTNDYVTRIVAYAADLDIGDAPLAPAVAQYGIEPSAVVKSGGGYHLYWFLQEPEPNTAEHAQQRKAFIALGGSDAVHDAARILRVPGTYNTKYGEPRPVELVKCDDQVRYPDWVFQVIVNVPEKTRRRLYTGDVSGFKSRSERDWAVLRQLAIAGLTDDQIKHVLWFSRAGDRFREKEWPRLLERDLEAVRRLGPGRNAAEIFNNTTDNCYYKEAGGGAQKISTFVIEPTALLEGQAEDDDYIVGNIRAEGTTHVWQDIALPKRAFIDRRALNRSLGKAAWSWLGTDGDVLKLLPVLMHDIQQRGVPILRTVKALGRYGNVWITPTDVITPTGHAPFGESGYAYLNPHQERPQVAYPVVESDDEFRTYAGQLVRAVLDVNRREVTLPILCWFVATAFKPVLSFSGREFPILQGVGTRGAGKTTTLRSLMLPMFGYADPISYSCDTTDFVLLSLMTSTTSIPVALSEYRASVSNIERLLRRLRLAYDSGYDARGRPDQTTRSYELSAPVCVDGEMPIDDPAIMERSVIVTFHPEDLTDSRRASFNEAAKLVVENKFAERFVRWSLTHVPNLALADDISRQYLPDKLPDRVRKSTARIVVGYQALRAFLQGVYDLPDVDQQVMDSLTQDWYRTILLGDSGRTVVLVDEMVEDIVHAVVRARRDATVIGATKALSHTMPFLWRFESEPPVLYFNLASVINWWTQQRRSRGLPSLTRNAAQNQLRERVGTGTGQYIIEAVSHHTVAGPTSMYGVRIHDAIAAGLDIPTGRRQG